MSHKLWAYLSKHSKSSGRDRGVLLAIAHYANDDGGGAFPSIATLSGTTGLSESSVHRAIKQLQVLEELDVHRNAGGGLANLYRVKLENIGSAADRAAYGGVIAIPPATRDTGVRVTPKGSSLKKGDYYSSLPSGSGRLERSVSVAGSSTPADRSKPTPEPKDYRAVAAKNDYLTCSDCGAWLGRCHCDDYLNNGFDAAMRDTLDAGNPGPAQLASETAIREAYASWQPGKTRDVSQAEVDGSCGGGEAKVIGVSGLSADARKDRGEIWKKMSVQAQSEKTEGEGVSRS